MAQAQKANTLFSSLNPRPTSPPPGHASGPSAADPIPTSYSFSSLHIIQPTQPVHTMLTRFQSGIFKPNFKYASLALATSSPFHIYPISRSHLSVIDDPTWYNTMWDEYHAMTDTHTWDLVPHPADANIVCCLWVFTHKEKPYGTFERYKSHLVANGKSQEVGVDCGETFSPVVRPITICTVLSLAVSRHLSIHRLDVKNAFLHGDLQKTNYMHQPLGFVHPDKPKHLCLLQKFLYGLKQAPCYRYQRFATYILSLGFQNSKCDTSLFIFRRGSDIAYLLLYVDNVILTYSSDDLKTYVISLLSYEFAMKDLGPLSYFLGISVSHTKDSMFMC